MCLGPKVKDDLRSEEGRRLSRLTKFRIIEEKLKVGVSIGGGQSRPLPDPTIHWAADI
jgi:hypothetical protein